MPSPFETAIGKLSALLGDDTPEATAYGVKNALAGFPGVSKVTNALNPDPQVTNRASMLPIGNYDDGSVGLAWPQSLIDSKEALGRFGRGENPQPQDAVLAGLAMAGGGFIPKPVNTVGMFGGRMAATADHAALSRAEQMAAKGASREDIWDQTGWFQGADNKWRFEIDDSGSWRSNVANTGRADEVLKHPDLYAAYPDLAATHVRKLSSGSGPMASYTPPAPLQYQGVRSMLRGDGLFSAPSPEAIRYQKSDFNSHKARRAEERSVLLHELQHAVQQREGFARGASSSEYPFSSRGEYEASPLVNAYADAKMRQDGLDPKNQSLRDYVESDDIYAHDSVRDAYEFGAWRDINHHGYRRSAGEDEARAVQMRQDMAPEERLVVPPWPSTAEMVLGARVPYERQILQEWGKPSPMPSEFLPQRPAAPVDPEYLPPARVANPRRSAPTLEGTVGQSGNTFFSNPKEAAPAGVLAMDTASRMERAKQMGFDTENVYYHGAKQPIDEFKPSHGGELGFGTYVTRDPSQAAEYTRPGYGGEFPDGANIVPVHVRGGMKEMNRDDWVNRRLSHMNELRAANGGEWSSDFIRQAEQRVADEIGSEGFGGFYTRNPDGEPSLMYDQGVIFDPRNIRSVNAAFDPAKSDSANILAANPKEAAPAGLLAASSLDRMRVEDAARARSIPEAPQSLPQLQGHVDSNLDRYAVSRSVGDRAHAEDPARYNAYTRGLHDVMNPDAEWMADGPTLQSGGAGAAAVGTSGEHHSTSQPRGQGGKFVGRDSFDGRLAALDKMMVDLDGDGKPDIALPVRPANALMAQQSAPDYLNQRGYQQQPPAVQKFEQDQNLGKTYMDALFARQKQYETQGMSSSEALAKAQGDDDLNALWRKSMGMP